MSDVHRHIELGSQMIGEEVGAFLCSSTPFRAKTKDASADSHC